MRYLDFKGYVFLTTTYSGRVPLLIATLSNVMMHVRNAHFVVQWCDDADASYVNGILHMIARNTGNHVFVNYVPVDVSVAMTKLDIRIEGMTHFVNLDDDLLVTQKSLTLLWGLAAEPVVTIGVQDGDDSRGFKDYDEVLYQSFDAFLAVHPLGKAKHHRFANLDTFYDYQWISQLYCMRSEVYNDAETWYAVRSQFQEKGVRGYDICLENTLRIRNIPAVLIVGCEALHIGLEYGYIGGPWKSADACATPVVTTEEGYAIRKS